MQVRQGVRARRSRACPLSGSKQHASCAISSARSYAPVSRFSPTINFVSQMNIAVLLLYGGSLVGGGSMSLGDLIVFAGLLQQFVGAGLEHGWHRQHAAAEPDRRRACVRGAGRAARGEEPRHTRRTSATPEAPCASSTWNSPTTTRTGDPSRPRVRDPARAARRDRGPDRLGQDHAARAASRASTTSRAAASCSTATTYARSSSTSYGGTSGSCSRRASCSRPRSPRTSPSVHPARRPEAVEHAARARRRARVHRRSSSRATTRCSRKARSTSPGDSDSAWPWPARSSSSRRSCCSTSPRQRSMPRPNTKCCAAIERATRGPYDGDGRQPAVVAASARFDPRARSGRIVERGSHAELMTMQGPVLPGRDCCRRPRQRAPRARARVRGRERDERPRRTARAATARLRDHPPRVRLHERRHARAPQLVVLGAAPLGPDPDGDVGDGGA